MIGRIDYSFEPRLASEPLPESSACLTSLFPFTRAAVILPREIKIAMYRKVVLRVL